MGISKFTDNDVNVTGTVRANFWNMANRENVFKTMAYLKDKQIYEWVLVRAYEEVKSTPHKKRKIQSNTIDNYLTNPIPSSGKLPFLKSVDLSFGRTKSYSLLH